MIVTAKHRNTGKGCFQNREFRFSTSGIFQRHIGGDSGVNWGGKGGRTQSIDSKVILSPMRTKPVPLWRRFIPKSTLLPLLR